MKPVNRILAFDVSNNNCSVAISAGQEILAYEEDLRPSMQAEILILLIERALQSINYDYQDIDYLALTNGPGSFTGIRIGLATAEGILISTNIQGLAISNFEMSYYRLQRQVKYFDKAVILLNAYRQQLYYQEFDLAGNTILPRFAKINATQVCKYADEKINKGEVNQGIGPLYIRPPDAKIPTKRTIF